MNYGVVLPIWQLTVAEADIADIRSLMTMVGGKIVYEMPGWAD